MRCSTSRTARSSWRTGPIATAVRASSLSPAISPASRSSNYSPPSPRSGPVHYGLPVCRAGGAQRNPPTVDGRDDGGLRFAHPPYSRIANRKLQRIPEPSDLRPLLWVGETADPALHIVVHVVGIAGRRDDAGHRRLGEDVFQEQLRPAGA